MAMSCYRKASYYLFPKIRFDGRSLLDFIRDPDTRRFRQQEKTEEEEELEEFVNFERYRDLIKHRRRGCRYFLDILMCDRLPIFIMFSNFLMPCLIMKLINDNAFFACCFILFAFVFLN